MWCAFSHVFLLGVMIYIYIYMMQVWYGYMPKTTRQHLR